MEDTNIAAIYEEYAQRVYRYMRYRVSNVSDAEDLTSATFERVVVSLHRFSAGRGSFDAWLFAIARNQLRDYLRRMKRRGVLALFEAEDQPSPETSPEQTLMNRQRFEGLGRALHGLNRREMQIVSLKYAGGLRNKDIAKILRLSEKNVGVILCRAMKKMRNMLTEEDFYEY